MWKNVEGLLYDWQVETEIHSCLIQFYIIIIIMSFNYKMVRKLKKKLFIYKKLIYFFLNLNFPVNDWRVFIHSSAQLRLRFPVMNEKQKKTKNYVEIKSDVMKIWYLMKFQIIICFLGKILVYFEDVLKGSDEVVNKIWYSWSLSVSRSVSWSAAWNEEEEEEYLFLLPSSIFDTGNPHTNVVTQKLCNIFYNHLEILNRCKHKIWEQLHEVRRDIHVHK